MSVVPLAQNQRANLALQQQTFQEQPIHIYYHKSTANKSFVEMSNYLKAIGVQNHRFMLTLLDPDLAGIDPHDPNLSVQYKFKVLKEVRNNFWYFIREVVRIPTSGDPSPFILNRGNMAFLYLAIMNINTILMLPRQTGKTIASACFYTYVYNFRTQNTQISLLNKEFKDSKDNLNRIRAIRDLLPSYLRFDAVFSKINGKKVKVPSTAIFMENAVNHNKLRTFGKARNELSAAMLMRGNTTSLAHFDEFAFIPFLKIIMQNSMPAMSKAIEIAKRNNVPYGILLTSTPGFLTTEEGKYGYNLRNNATKFNEGFYDLTYYQLIDLIHANKFSNYILIEFSYQDLGYSEEWFYEKCKELEWDWPTIRREYLLEWSDEAENSPFTKEELDTIKKFCKKPKKTFLIFGKYELKIFEEIPLMSNLVPKYPPIIGVDPAGGVSKDFSCITLIDSKTTRVFAEMRCNSMSLIDLARVIQYIITNMTPNAIVNVERNGGYGLSVISALKETPVKRNLYYEIKDKILEETVEGGRLVRKLRKTKVFGLQSTKEVRDQLIELLMERVRHHKDKFISPTLYEEMRGLEVKKDRVEHSDLTHDDQIFSYLLSLYVWYYGKNLRENFGIQKFGIKTEDSVDDVVDLTNGVEEVGSIVEEMVSLTRDDTDPLNAQLAQMNQAKGMMFSEYVAKQRQVEEERLKLLLQNPKIKEAYAKNYGITPDMVSAGTDDHFGMNESLPDSVFTDFNKDLSEMDQGSVYQTLNQPMVSGSGYPDEDESQQ